MDRLFIELYLGEDVDVLLAELIKARGFRMLTTQEAEQTGQDDESQLAYATRQVSLLTHNRADFEVLHERYIATGHSHTGIIVAVRRPPYERTHRLLRLLNTFDSNEMEKQLMYI